MMKKLHEKPYVNLNKKGLANASPFSIDCDATLISQTR